MNTHGKGNNPGEQLSNRVKTRNSENKILKKIRNNFSSVSLKGKVYHDQTDQQGENKSYELWLTRKNQQKITKIKEVEAKYGCQYFKSFQVLKSICP